MKNSIKPKGRLKIYLQTSLYIEVLLILIDIAIFAIDVRAGLILACFLLFYFLVIGLMLVYSRPVSINELISVATQ